MPSIYEIASELSRRWPELNRDGESNRADTISAVISQMLEAQTRCSFCGCLFNTGNDYGKEKLREHIQTCDKSPLVATLIAAESLVVHMWVHSAYKNNGYLQMTTEQKIMYCAAIGAKFDPIEPKFEEQQPKPKPEPKEKLCRCRACIRARGEKVGGFPEELTTIIVCDICGNKRCPRASHHKFECTNSNEPGQPGSDYE